MPSDSTAYETVSLSALDDRYRSLRLARPSQVDTVRRSITRHGLLVPLTVNRPDESGQFTILDGFKRFTVLSERDETKVSVRVMHLHEAQAKAAIITFNAPHRGLNQLEEAWVIASLVREHEMSQQDVAELLGRHTSWVCRRLQLVERLAPALLEDLRLGLLAPSAARELVRLPRGNQTRVAHSVMSQGLTSRQASKLVSCVLEADSESAIDALLAHPLRAIEEPQVSLPQADPHLTRHGAAIWKGLAQLVRSVSTANWLIQWHHSSLAETDLALLDPLIVALHDARGGLSESLQTLSASNADYESNE